jgi:hypothetical protein
MLCAICLLATPALGQAGSGPSEAQLSAWEEQLARAQEDLLDARVRLFKAEDAYRDWRQRKYPRGAKKADLLAEIDEARTALAVADAALPELLERARRAGAPPGLLRRFEEPPASPDE